MPELEEHPNILRQMSYDEFADKLATDESFARRLTLDQAAYVALIKQGWVQSWPGALLSMLGPVFLVLGIIALVFFTPYVGGALLAAAPTCFFLANIVTRKAIWREFRGEGKLPLREVRRLYETAVANNLLWMYDNN